MKTTQSLPKFPTYVLLRVYRVRQAKFAGEMTDVIGEQVGGDFNSRADAESAAAAQDGPCQIIHIGGVES